MSNTFITRVGQEDPDVMKSHKQLVKNLVFGRQAPTSCNSIKDMTRLLKLTLLGLSVLGCSDKKGGLDGNIQTLELTYITWACDCAN